MLNYIWAGLIVFSLVFALVNDTLDLSRDTYANGRSLDVTIVESSPSTSPGSSPRSVTVQISPHSYRALYSGDELKAASFAATLIEAPQGRELRFASDAPLPPRLAKIRDLTASDDKQLRAVLTQYVPRAGATRAALRFPAVRWVSMQAISNAAIEMAKTAVTLALGLVGTLALWLGMMQIAEKAGLINLVVRFTGPLLRPLFPGIPKGHPAMGMVTLNLTANMLGLSNAATPFGIKAMEELQKLNKTTDTATNSMVMLLAMNTAGVQLLPPVFLYAVMGIRANELYFPILAVTGIALVIAIITTKLLGRLPGYRASDPDRIPAAIPAGGEA
jgi:spore maturation protein A